MFEVDDKKRIAIKWCDSPCLDC